MRPAPPAHATATHAAKTPAMARLATPQVAGTAPGAMPAASQATTVRKETAAQGGKVNKGMKPKTAASPLRRRLSWAPKKTPEKPVTAPATVGREMGWMELAR